MLRTPFIASRIASRLFNTKRWYSTHASPSEKKITLQDVKKKYNEGIPLSMVTAYDYTSAYFVDKAAVDIILVGDSLGMVMLGRSSTTEVTMDEMLHHCKAVARGTKRSFVVGDLPFGSFEASTAEAIRNSCRLVKEGLVSAVKLEGGKVRKDTVKAIVEAGIPVIGHIGLTPQTCAAFGGFRVHGKSAQDAASIYEDAIALQAAGCSAIVIEFVPEMLGQEITKALNIPTFGIGAGRFTSGQVLVYHDMLGMYPDFTPKFCKKLGYANVAEEITKGISMYKQEVEAKQFPATEHTFSMKPEEWEKTRQLIVQMHPKEEKGATNLENEVAAPSAKEAIVSTEAMKKEPEKLATPSQTEPAKLTPKQAEPEKVISLKKPELTVPKQAKLERTVITKKSVTLEKIEAEIPETAKVLLKVIENDCAGMTNFDVYYNSYFGNLEEGKNLCS